MSYVEQSLIHRSKLVLIEVVSILFLGLFIVAFLTVLDIDFHDFYVKPIIAECYPENNSKFCQDLRIKHGCDPSEQLCLGNIYWRQLAQNGIFVGVVIASTRLLFAGLLKVYIHKKITPATILMVITYGVIGSGLFFFGFLDTFYYWFQFDEVPTELSWLNSAGIFIESKTWFGDPSVVEIEDLYATNIVGIGLIGLLAFATMVLQANRKRSSNALA